MNWNDYFTADFETGTLTRRHRNHIERRRIQLTWNTRFGGKIVGCQNRAGYLVVRIFDKLFYVHRILWEMANGPIQEGYEIDHIDRNRSNNILSNLRLATHAENGRNTKLMCNNTSGIRGVSWSNRDRRWIAQIRHNGQTIWLGMFHNKEDAADAYTAASVKYHGKFAPTAGRLSPQTRRGDW